MDYNKLEESKKSIIENIEKAKEMKINKITAILAIMEDDTQKDLLNWLILEGYKVSLKKDEYSILSIEW